LNFTPLKYKAKTPTDFFKTLKGRIDEHFISNNKERFGDYRMYLKTTVMLIAYLAPFCFIVFEDLGNNWLYLALWSIMGVFMAGIGLSIMHDAIHGSYSKNKTLNKVLGEVINFVGGASINWKIQHNVLHHTYTNVEEYDQDLDGPSILRFSPNQKKIKIHKYQHIYAWLIYCLLTLNWSTYKDFNSILKYKKMGLIGGGKNQFSIELIKIILTKILYFSFILFLPLSFSSASIGITILGFFIMNGIASLILSSIFQPAHVMEECEFAIAEDDNIIKQDWAAHQILNTVNFAPKNKLLSWFVGGLNFQIEHHLFPNICHIHYKDLSKIVEKTAKEFGLPYFVQPTFRSALLYHAKMLKKLGAV
jgi:linoleoyl-CoA desaturase